MPEGRPLGGQLHLSGVGVGGRRGQFFFVFLFDFFCRSWAQKQVEEVPVKRMDRPSATETERGRASETDSPSAP